MGWSFQQKPPMGWPLDYNSGLVPEAGFWPFNEGSGGQVRDLSGNGNTGLFGAGAASPIWVPGKFGSCLSFDGGDYIDTGMTGNYGKAVTISLWCKFGVATPVVAMLIGSAYYTNNEFILMQHDTAGLIRFTIANGSFVDWTIPNFDLVNWFHLVLVVDTAQAANADKVKLYSNGILVTQDLFSGLTTEDLEATSVIKIGGQNNYFTGLIDIPMMFVNHASSASEVALLYREPFCMFKDPAEMILAAAGQTAAGAVMAAYYYRHLLQGAA